MPTSFQDTFARCKARILDFLSKCHLVLLETLKQAIAEYHADYSFSRPAAGQRLAFQVHRELIVTFIEIILDWYSYDDSVHNWL